MSRELMGKWKTKIYDFVYIRKVALKNVKSNFIIIHNSAYINIIFIWFTELIVCLNKEILMIMMKWDDFIYFYSKFYENDSSIH